MHRVGLGGVPVAPYQISDEVEDWARGRGRHASLEFIPTLSCWAIRIELPPHHPSMKLYKDGLSQDARPPTEDVLLHEWSEDLNGYVAMDIEQLGPSGIRELLEKGDTWSGRGEFASLTEAVEATIETNRRRRAEMQQYAQDVGEEMGAIHRRQALGLPFTPVLANLEPSPPTPTVETP